MARKVFMSVLGSTNYQECLYVDSAEDFRSHQTKFIQTAMLEKIAKSWTDSDVANIFITSGVKGSGIKNWEDNGHLKFGTDEKILSKGLKKSIEELKLNVNVNAVFIKRVLSTEY